MFGTFGAPSRRFVVPVIFATTCLSLLLFAAGSARAGQVVASWYGPGFEGAATASGEPFDPDDYTAAHRTLPFGTKLIVTYGGRSVVVRVNDRGPYVTGRDLDLSQAAAEYIGLTAVGVATVDMDHADPADPTGPYPGGAPAEGSATPQAPPAGPRETSATADQRDPVQERQTPRLAGLGADEEQYAIPDQQAAEIQYAEPSAAADQYAEPSDASTAAAVQYAEPDATPRGAPTPVPPPAPAPAELEAPPAELAAPGSTVELRIQFGVAAPPPGYAGPLPSGPDPVERRVSDPEHTARPAVKAEASPGVLPETGGAPLGALLCGCLLTGLGSLLIGRTRG